MKITPLGKLVVVALCALVAWRFFAPRVPAIHRGNFFTQAPITGVDVMVLVALAFVALLVILRGRSPPSS